MNKVIKNMPLSIVTAAILLALTACSSDSPTPPAPEPVNQAPTGISLSGDSIEENSVVTIVGSLTANDPDTADSFTFSTNDDNFEISGTNLQLKEGVSFDFEKVQSADVAITVTDSGNLSYSETFTINVTDVLDTYAFNNAAGESTVAYSGQITRLALISELNQYISSELQVDLESSALTSHQAILDKLNSFYDISSEEYDLIADNFVIDFISGLEQMTLRDLSSSKKDILGKVAGSDAVGQHKDWNNGEFAGWGELGSTTPHNLVQDFFSLLADHGQDYIDGTLRTDFNGAEITKIYLTSDGRDLKQLIQKHLLGAVAFSQGVDDYFDNDVEGKGLNSTNIAADKPYSSLEHQWDEGYGYFGAARDYLSYTDDEIAGKGGREDYATGKHDSDGNTFFDLLSEVNLGNSTNAAKRDRGTASLTNPTDFTTAAFTALLNGRKIINDNLGAELTEEQMTALLVERDIVVEYWEKSISATAVHYINDLLADLENIDTENYSYSTLAKHWSELKGFALNLQFSRFSPLSDADFVLLHTLIGDVPVVSPDAELTQYKADLLTARALLEVAYGFDAENVANW